jgi:MSHA biogenesis protein MshE
LYGERTAVDARCNRRTGDIVNIAGELEELSDISFRSAIGASEEGDESCCACCSRSWKTRRVRVGRAHRPDNRAAHSQRVDGVLQETTIKETRIAAALVSRLKLIAGLDISEKRLPQDGRFETRVKGRDIDVRSRPCPCSGANPS